MDSLTSNPEKSARRKRAEALGWIYYHSEILGMDYRVRMTPLGPEMQTEDGVAYDYEELAILGRHGGEVPKLVHLMKKVLTGDVVEK